MRRNTIFVNLFSHLVMGNFGIPGGVIEQLIEKAPEGTRIVFLVNEKVISDLKKYQKSPKVVIEAIQKIDPAGVIQKTFQFFYSYLIFTGTTKILATFGARADIPPAGGNRHLWFVKSLIANTFGASTWIKTRAIPWLYQRIFSARPYRELFERYEPNLVVTPNIAFVPDVELVSEAKRRGIPTLGMACNWDHLNKYFIPMQADALLVQNEPMRSEAVELQGYKMEQTVAVGFPQFDLYNRIQSQILSRKEFLEYFNIPEGNKIVLFISGAAYALDEPDILKAIEEWMEKGELGDRMRLMVRPYVVGRDKEREEKKYSGFVSNPHIAFNWVRGDDPSIDGRKLYFSMFFYSDVIISMFSTTAIEAAILDKPTITIGFDGYKKRPDHQSVVRLERMSHFQHVLKTDSVKIARSFENLKEMLKTYLEHPEIDADKRKNLVEKMCYKQDGLASARIAEKILEHTKEKRTPA